MSSVQSKIFGLIVLGLLAGAVSVSATPYAPYEPLWDFSRMPLIFVGEIVENVPGTDGAEGGIVLKVLETWKGEAGQARLRIGAGPILWQTGGVYVVFAERRNGRWYVDPTTGLRRFETEAEDRFPGIREKTAVDERRMLWGDNVDVCEFRLVWETAKEELGIPEVPNVP